MDLVWQGLVRAFEMLLAGDPELGRITWLTLRVSGTATLVSVVLGVPTGVLLALGRFPGRRLLISLVNTGMGLPPVVVGLWVSLLLWRYGPLGFLNLMYTPAAMVIAQSVIATPVVAAFTVAGVGQLNPRLALQITAMGASRWQLYWLLVREARLSILAAVIAGFGSVVSEVGASMMVGGNVLGQTRVLTTATVMEVSKGNFDVALALSVILLALTYGVTAVLTLVQQRRRPA
ncbi:ABC transporter permease [Caldinitratiruptor microaerophilus]|uniref:ABC transporter permease n=1 Tax=Caldinitratiruptor microaerophilus TaxID=671077 RepID=A0AA35GA92_9FIRM|nr:ABC transporter permease [Caldinitratiruptor microaerophilus]BDG62268.1 ABC transporter permease [Caldinitratiruptor microaerophilus]